MRRVAAPRPVVAWRGVNLQVGFILATFDLAMTLLDVASGRTVTIEQVGGERSFRRRLLDLGLLPGTQVTVTGSTPFGGPLTLLARGCHLSLRAREARNVAVRDPLMPSTDRPAAY